MGYLHAYAAAACACGLIDLWLLRRKRPWLALLLGPLLVPGVYLAWLVAEPPHGADDGDVSGWGTG